MPFDEAVLDDADILERRDEGRLLWSLATCGAQVRRALELASETHYDKLAGDRPRSVLIATDAPSTSAARVLERIVTPVSPTIVWGGVDLPKWAGPTDALLVGTVDGRHPRLAGLVQQAVRRGLAVAVATPDNSPVSDAAGPSPVAPLPENLNVRASRWSVLTPLLEACDALGVLSAPRGMLQELADALDETAEACRPVSDAFTNPAKALAAEFAESIPVIAGAGTLAGVAARLFADVLQLFAGSPALFMSLPDSVARAGAVLSGAPSQTGHDFFRDRSEDVVLRPRLVVIGDDGDPDDPRLGERTGAQIQLDEIAARKAASALHRIAREHGIKSSSVDVPQSAPLVRFAAATAFGDYTAAYLAFGLGMDPSAPRPGELAH